MPDLQVAVLSYDDLRRQTEQFLAEHHSAGTLPIPIDEIIEFRLGIQIVVEACLRPVCGIDGLPAGDGTAIYIDADVWLRPSQNRCRFSLAEELAHIQLHAALFSALEYTTLAEYKTAVTSIDEEKRGWIEWQAKSWAGLVLVPSAKLQESVERLSVENASVEGDLKDYMVNIQLGEEFAVSTNVIERRRTKENV